MSEFPNHQEVVEQLNESEYIKQALENLSTTSRTAKGVVDTSASADKVDKMAGDLNAATAAERAQSNFEQVITYLFENRDKQFQTTEELKQFVENVAGRINSGITKEGVLIREGADSAKYPYTKVADLSIAMDQFYEELLQRLNNPSEDPKNLAGWVEYRIDLTDHFFADGCGKTAKAISSWILMRAHNPLPKYRDRKELYENAPTQIRGQDPEIDKTQLKKWLGYYNSLFV